MLLSAFIFILIAINLFPDNPHFCLPGVKIT